MRSHGLINVSLNSMGKESLKFRLFNSTPASKRGKIIPFKSPKIFSIRVDRTVIKISYKKFDWVLKLKAYHSLKLTTKKLKITILLLLPFILLRNWLLTSSIRRWWTKKKYLKYQIISKNLWIPLRKKCR